MLKLATVVFPLFGAFDLVLVRRSPSVPPRTIETTGVSSERPSARPLAKCGAATNVVVPFARKRTA